MIKHLARCAFAESVKKTKERTASGVPMCPWNRPGIDIVTLPGR
jgi:hypothetical protein